ncbi:MAG: PKD domain-containing protein [Acidobacteria bacterium]|nr:PKD domain-containing protein [Acidobacteriota bacterium]
MKHWLGMFLAMAAAGIADGATYEVGPGRTYASIGAAPLSTLQPGDTVRIYYRSTPYKEKFVICRQGTAAAPISITGVPGPAGELPIIEGIDAVTAPGQNYWSESRGIVKIGGANTPPDTMPRYIVVENLEIRGARPSYSFTDRNGAAAAYAANASTIYVEKCENCTIRNNILHDSGNGFFVASSDAAVSRDIVVEGNRIYDGGNSGSIYEHNIYTAAVGIRFERNWLGPLIAGAGGNNLKDRSAGTVIRYNWIDGGNRQLDLVDGEDSSIIRADPSYRAAFVYGNVLREPAGAGNRQILHYGGDSGATATYRKGTLYFYNNTVISLRTDRTTLFRASTNEETIDARNNLFYSTAAGSTVSLADDSGVFNLSHNWIKPGWVTSFGSFTGTVNNDGTMVTGTSPGFVDETGEDYRLSGSSACVNAGGNLNPAALPANDVTQQYVKQQGIEPRPVNGVLDIGAFEFGSGGGNQPPVVSFTGTPTSGTIPLTVDFSASGSSDPDGTITAYAWEFGDGGTGSGVMVAHTYNAVGSYIALLRVTDNGGATSSATQTITVNPLAAPVLSGSASGANVSLSWTAVAGATSYAVERRIKNGSWTLLSTVTGTALSTAAPNGNVSFRVRAINSAALSAYSNVLTLRIR